MWFILVSSVCTIRLLDLSVTGMQEWVPLLHKGELNLYWSMDLVKHWMIKWRGYFFNLENRSPKSLLWVTELFCSVGKVHVKSAYSWNKVMSPVPSRLSQLGCTCVFTQNVWVSSVQLATISLKRVSHHIGNCQNMDNFRRFKRAQDFVLVLVFHGSGAA